MINSYKVFIFTSDPDSLVKFYTNALGFKIINKLEYPEDYGYTIEVENGENKIWLARHSKVNGNNKDTFRFIINFYTNDIDKDWERLSKYEGVKVVTKLHPMSDIVPTETRYVGTVLDPEGNCVQLMGTNA